MNNIKNSNKLKLSKQHIILKRALITILITIVYITLTEIPLPYLNLVSITELMSKPQIKSLQILSILTGGNIQQGSIMMVGFMPFITIQLIIQVLQLGISKRMKKLSENNSGQKHVGQITKLLTFPLALIQAGFTLAMIQKLTDNQAIQSQGQSSILVFCYLIILIAGGTMLSVWLSDLNTLYGLGNGINYLVSCSIIVSSIENINLNSKVVTHLINHIKPEYILICIFILVVFILYNVLCIWYQNSTYRLDIQFSQLDSSVDNIGNLPLSLNIANVMPIIFTGMLMNILYTLNLWHDDDLQIFFNFKSWESIVFYTITLIIFTYLFTFIQFYPGKLYESLDRMNAYIVGVDPTIETVSYLWKSLIMLATLNAVFFFFMVIIPMIICKLLKLPESLVLSVSSVLIVVTTEADIRRQIIGLRSKELKTDLIK